MEEEFNQWRTAIRRGNADDLVMVVNYIEANRHNPFKINAIDEYGRTALIEAAARGQTFILDSAVETPSVT